MSNDENEGSTYQEESIPVAIVGLIFLLPVFILDKLNQQPIRSQNARWLMFCVIASNALHHTTFVVQLLVCTQCKIQYCSWGVTKAILKGFNLLFFIHRANLVQGITPVLSKKWFEKIFPACTVVIISGFIFASIDAALEIQTECAPYDDWDGLSHCQRVRDPEQNPDADGGDKTT